MEINKKPIKVFYFWYTVCMEQSHSFLKNIGTFFLGAIIYFCIGFQLFIVDFWPMHQDSKVSAVLVLLIWVLLLIFSFIVSRILIKGTRYKKLRIILIIIILIVFGLEIFTLYASSRMCGVAGCETDQIELSEVIY